MLTLTLSDELTPRLNAAIAAATDFTPAMRAIADQMHADAVLRFETESGPDGERWVPSARAVAEGGQTLTDTGHLKGSLTAAHDARSAILGTNLIYAAIHQFGGRIVRSAAKSSKRRFGPPKPGAMPARPFLGFSADDAASIEAILADHLSAAFKGGAPGAAA